MTKEDRNRADARFNKATRAANDARTGRTDRDAALKAVTDNMAKLKALRLAREAAAPTPPAAAAKKARAKPKKAGEKGPALADWLAGQQSGGRRT
jgi:choline dehydrogenase-like flavoprotein